MNYFMIVMFQLTYIVPSLILYFTMFLYICWSGDPEFKSAFHRLFIARAPADVCQVMISLIAFRFPIAGWEGCLSIPHLEKIGFVLSQYTFLLELCALLMLSANRLSAIAVPISHNKIWSVKSTYTLFVVSAIISLIPTSVRLPQSTAYINITGSYVPYLVNEEDQAQNSIVSCTIYIFFCTASLVCNIIAICIHSKQRKMQLFETQPKLAAKVQTNLLIYSCIFTTLVIAMTTFQCLLAIDAFPLRSDAHNIVIVFLTLSADAFALSNPWLLFCLSSTFRHKFLEARRFPKIFSTSSTNETS